MTTGRSRVLVTGAGGFIGRQCLPLLSARGFEVHAVSRSRREGPDAIWHSCDITAGSACEALIDEVRPSHLLHLAWIAEPGVFWTSPENAHWADASGRLFARFFQRAGSRAVGCGSCAEYGTSATPCREDSTPIEPPTTYGRSKAAAQKALESAAGHAGSWAWARLFFPYGPGEPAGRFIPSVINGLLRGESISCTHGRQVRDFIHVDDVARACVALVESDVCGPFNIGSGIGHSLREVARAIIARTGHGELVRFGEREPPANDLDYVVADIRKIGEAVGWSPHFSLQQGLNSAIAAQVATMKVTGAP